MSDDVRVAAPVTIRAELSIADPDVCKFTVSRVVNPAAGRFFAAPGEAAGSPLAERLFELPGVAHVLVAADVVTVGKHPEASWASLKAQVAAIIRSQLQSGVPPVIEARQALPSPGRTDAEIRALVQALLDTEVNPSVAAHGGAIVLTDVREGRLYLEMRGGCRGCAASQVTLRQGFERMVRRVVPEVGEIIDTTDHAGGQSPYYPSA
jgi:Fe-S cluster biogenesis protein NfuA